MKRSLAITGLAVCLLTGACGTSDDSATAKENSPYKKLETTQAKTEPAVQAADVTWYTNWDEGMAVAKKENKPVFIHFTADWCRYCVKMKKETYAAGEIKQRFNDGWITILVDTEDRDFKGNVYINESEKKLLAYLDGDKPGYEVQNLDIGGLTRNFGVRGLPTLVFIDKDGAPLQSISSFIEKKEFGTILDFFQEGAYETMQFDEYQKKVAGKS